MSKTVSSSAGRLAAAGVAAALLLGGCAATDSSSSSGDAGSVGFTNIDDASAPVDGGTVTFGSYSFPNSLDPTKTQTSGSTGGSEMAAIYDTLVRAEDEGFVPQLAKSINHNDDFTTFTITLREGVTFSDDSPLDANAVKWSIDRFVAAGADTARDWAEVVESISTPDSTTVEFELNDSWDNFPVLLSMGPGLIVGKNSEMGDDFTPIGAGAFTLQNFAPNEELALVARQDYFGGKPPLAALRFVPTAGTQGQLESLNSGQLNMAYILGDEEVIADADDSGYSGYLDVVGLGSLALINNREGRPGSDVRVRQAIAYGVDPEAINERVNNGLGIASSAILPESSRWYDGAEGIAFDPEKAKELLDSAKSDGYDGKISYLTFNERRAQASALATQGALNSIGFDVSIDYASSATDLVRKLYVENDFDMTRSSYQFMDEAPYLRLAGGMESTSQNNAAGYSDATMDQLLSDVKTAITEDDKREALNQVQNHANETTPYAIWGPNKIFVAWDNNLHSVKRSSDNIILFDSAWID